MIAPSGRAVVLAAAMALPAIAVAVLLPQFWYAGLVGVILVVALTVVDGFAATMPAQVATTLTAPAAAFVGQRVEIGMPQSVRRQQGVVEHDTRLSANSAKPRSPLHSFTAVRRGRAELAALWQRWPGPFGLAWRQRRVVLDRAITVTPDTRPARDEAIRLFRRDASNGETVQPDIGAGGEFQSLTEFRTGMDRRAIDWKASGRHGGLIAKEYRTERNNDIVFAIDAGRLMSEPVDGVPRIDRATAAALAGAFVALKLGDRVSLYGFDSRPRVASGALSGVGAFGTIQRVAAELDYSSEETNFTFALTTLASQLKRRSLVVIFTDFVDPTSAETMLATVGRLTAKHAVLFVLMRDAELDAMVDAAPTTADDVSRAVIAGAMLRERRIVIARLQRLGAQIVEAHYAQLGSSLVNAYLDLKRRNRL